jgi:hypothetical protein
MVGKKNVRVGKGIKNRVGATRLSGTLQNQLKLNLGVDQALLIRAFNNDHDALRTIGQLGIDGARISSLAPKIKEQMLAAIKGSEDLNVTLSEIYKQAGTSGTAIQRATQSAELSNGSLKNSITEMDIDFRDSKDKESLRHARTLKRLELKDFIDRHITSSDADYQLLKEELRLPEKQRTIDLAHDKELGQYYLGEGDRANAEFKPKQQASKPWILEKIGNLIRGI